MLADRGPLPAASRLLRAALCAGRRERLEMAHTTAIDLIAASWRAVRKRICARLMRLHSGREV